MITKCLIDHNIYTRNIYSVCHSKNDLPSIMLIRSGYRHIGWNNKQMVHRDNDLPNFIVIRRNINFNNNTYDYGYNKYDNWHKYNGYSYISYTNNKITSILYKFFNGICVKFLKNNLN